jgi:hypothetical protein
MTVQNGDENRGIEDYRRTRDSKKRNEKLALSHKVVSSTHHMRGIRTHNVNSYRY